MIKDTVLQGDAYEMLKTLPDESIDCCVTSPPYYGLRDYGTGEWVGGNKNCDHSSAVKVCPECGAIRVDNQIGLEETPEEYIEKLVNVFREVKRVLKDNGTLWLNIGDSYATGGGRTERKQSKNAGVGANNPMAQNSVPFVGTPKGCKGKDLIGIPWALAFALRSDGWYLRQDIIWHKPNPMPESVKDRCTKSHEYIFLLSKKPHYYFDYEAIQEDSKWANDKRAGQGRIAYNGKRATGEDTKAQQSFVAITDKRNKRDVWTECESKYADTAQEAQMRQGMSKDRGNNLVYLRKNLPTQEEFVAFMRKVSTAEQLANETDIKRSTIDHWFRSDKSGFSYPSVEDWLQVRDFLDDWSEQFMTIDQGLTNVTVETDEVGKNNQEKRNKRDVWSVNTKPVKEAHFATFPEKLIEPCILAGCPIGGVVLDPFFGSGTTGRVASRLNRHYVGIELNPEYIEISERRTDNVQMSIEGFMI